MKRNPNTRRPLQICFVTQQFYSFSDRFELNDFVYGAAQTAANQGDRVAILWAPLTHVREKIGTEAEDILKDQAYTNHLVSLEILDTSSELTPGTYYQEKASLNVYHYLKRKKFDIVYFALEGGLGYFSLLSRELGLFDDGPEMAVIAHAPYEWQCEADRTFLRSTQEIVICHMERYSAENAGRLICSSKYIRHWMKMKGWSLPKGSEVLYPIRPYEWRSSTTYAHRKKEKIREVVFFSGHKYRHGISIFCDILDKLAKLDEPLQVTLLGEFSSMQGEHSGGMVLRRSRQWPFAIRMLPKPNEQQTLEYLKDHDCVAAIPSTTANAPLSLLTCLDEGIPFVAMDVGAARELVAPSARSACLSVPTPAAFAEKIRTAIVASKPVPTTYGTQSLDQAWIEHLAKIADRNSSKGSRRAPVKRSRTPPLVSVILVHHDRPQFLLQAIAAVEAQDYPNIELVVVDDGSELAESHRLLDQMEKRFAKRKGWKILREPNRYLGAARNAGIKACSGERILFVDDDNALFRNAVSTFVAAMDASGADICTAFSKVFHGAVVPPDESSGFIHYYPLGGSLDLALIHNSLGDANAMVRRAVFDKIGYQIEDYGCTVQDWEFFTRAIFAGFKLRIIPEPLYWYRSSTDGMYRSSNWYQNRLPILEVFKKHRLSDVEHAMQLYIAQNVDRSDKESFAYNLEFSASNELHKRLAKLEPNSKEAIELLAQIAAAEGRPDTALTLLGQTQAADFGKLAAAFLAPTSAVQKALTELGAGLRAREALSLEDLRMFTAAAERGTNEPPLFYIEAPDRLFMEASGENPAVAVRAAGCPAGTLSVSARVQLGEDIGDAAEFLLLMVPMHADASLAVAQAGIVSSEGSSGWCRVSYPGMPREISAQSVLPTAEPTNLVLAVRPHGAAKRVVGAFDKVATERALGWEALQRPRLGPPPHRQRARVVWENEFQSAKLVTPYPSELPLVLVSPNRGGLFLRPDTRGPVAAVLPWLFPPFARKVIASVEIAHEEASPFEFATALVRPDQEIDWSKEISRQVVAFSGWLRVEEKFTLHEVTVGVSERMRTHLSLALAVRLPRGSSPSPANAFFRKLVLAWDE